jgi:hypothetical protein
VPASIPTGTILYHGRNDDRVPDVPDWLAFDFEHAYLFSRSPAYVISLQAKRNLRLLYFDGSSAAKMKDGPMDSQDIITWGRPQPDKCHLERERIKILCDWGKPLGLDGFVRMEFHLFVSIVVNCAVVLRLIVLSQRAHAMRFFGWRRSYHIPRPLTSKYDSTSQTSGEAPDPAPTDATTSVSS